MIRTPDRANDARPLKNVFEKNAAAVVWTQCGQSFVSPWRPSMDEVPPEGKATDMNDSKVGRERGGHGLLYMVQLLQRLAGVAMPPQPGAHRPPAERTALEPGDEWGSLQNAAQADPRFDVGESLARSRESKSVLKIRSAFAQADQNTTASATCVEPVQDDLDILLAPTKTRDRDDFGLAAQLSGDGQHS